LQHTREMFQADAAEVVLFPEEDAAPLMRMSQGTTERETGLSAVELQATEGVTARVTAEREGVLLARPISNKHLARHFEQRDIRDAMVVPLLADEGVLGTLLVGNRTGEFSTFDEHDLELFQTLANHVAVAVHNARLVERLEASLAQETEMSKLKDDFVATISHELRTPLTSVQGYVKTLLRSDVGMSADERREFLARADRQAERLRRLIEDLLFAAKVEASRSLQLTQVDVGELVRRVVEEPGTNLPPHRLVSKVPPGWLTVETAEENVYMVFRNLVENALKYSAEGSTVTIFGERLTEGVTVSVQDEGRGIIPAERERIFDRFYQVDQSMTRSVGGAGMGLYICRQAAEAVGGRVWLERSDDRGSIFSVWLPRDARPNSPGDTPGVGLHAPLSGLGQDPVVRI
jgi:signal transduction histidine kinase